MAYEIEYTEAALRDLSWLRRTEQVLVLAAIDRQLRHEPTVETRNRKRLRPNPVADWELRLGELRVLYNVVEVVRVVEIERVGRKPGGRLLAGGQEVDL